MKMKKYILKIWNFGQRLTRRYKTKWVEDLPEKVEKNTICIVGGHKHPFYAAIACPRKKCKKVIHLEIFPESKKRWNFHEHKNGTLTLSPSICVTRYSCKCHYWIRKGRTVWCDVPPFLVPKENLIQ